MSNWVFPVASRADTKPLSPMQPNAVFSMAFIPCISPASSGIVGPRPFGYCSVHKTGSSRRLAKRIRRTASRTIFSATGILFIRESWKSITTKTTEPRFNMNHLRLFNRARGNVLMRDDYSLTRLSHKNGGGLIQRKTRDSGCRPAGKDRSQDVHLRLRLRRFRSRSAFAL